MITVNIVRAITFTLATWLFEIHLRACLLAAPMMLLWNFFVPEVLGFKQINFFQAVAMIAILGILFKSSDFIEMLKQEAVKRNLL